MTSGFFGRTESYRTSTEVRYSFTASTRKLLDLRNRCKPIKQQMEHHSRRRSLTRVNRTECSRRILNTLMPTTYVEAHSK
ncbi:MAG: hypothetical protein V7606_2697 [Burkholderiales bacterium]